MTKRVRIEVQYFWERRYFVTELAKEYAYVGFTKAFPQHPWTTYKVVEVL